MKSRHFAAFGPMLVFGLAALTLADSAAPQDALPLKLPRARFEGTPPNLKGVTLDPADPTNKGKDRPPFMAPKGVTNVALKKPVTSSDPSPIIGDLSVVTDGDAEAVEGGYVELAGDKPQWIQIDLGAPYEIYAIVFWHRHENPNVVYRDVVVQTADDQDFIKNVVTHFNNDQSNEIGLGAGKDFQYIETHYGKLVDGHKTPARYVRLYSKGSTANELNDYTEVQVFGLPVAK